MNTRQLEYVLMIEKEKSISKAAKKLYMTQPALSIFLARLESQMGLSLFERENNGLRLTYAGERYVIMAREVINLNRRLEQELCEINAFRKGRLTIGTSAHIGSSILPEVLSGFYQTYPNIEIEISEGTSEMLECMIEKAEVDIALMHLPLKRDAAEYVEIGKEKFVMAFSKESGMLKKIYQKAGDKYPYINPKEAVNEKFILAFPCQRVRQISDGIIARAGIVPEIHLVTSSVQTALRFAGIGLGVTFTPESYIQLFCCTHETEFCYMEDEFNAFWTFIIAYPKYAVLSEPIRKFIEITKKIYQLVS